MTGMCYGVIWIYDLIVSHCLGHSHAVAFQGVQGYHHLGFQMTGALVRWSSVDRAAQGALMGWTYLTAVSCLSECLHVIFSLNWAHVVGLAKWRVFFPVFYRCMSLQSISKISQFTLSVPCHLPKKLRSWYRTTSSEWTFSWLVTFLQVFIKYQNSLFSERCVYVQSFHRGF